MDKKIETAENNKQFNDKSLMAISIALSQVNAVKPMVSDNLYRAIEDLNSGMSIFDAARNFEDNINEDLKFQYVIDKMKPLYESFLSHIADKQNYQFMSYYEADDLYEEMDYDDTWGDGYKIRKQKEADKIKESFAKCRQEVKECLEKCEFNLADLDSINSQFVDKFFVSQSRAEDFYDFCTKVYEENKNSQAVDFKAPKFTATSEVTKTIDKLNKIANSLLVNKLIATNYCGSLSKQDIATFRDSVIDFATSDGFIDIFKNENLRGEIKETLPSVSKMLDVLIEKDGTFGPGYEKGCKNLSDMAKTLYFERVLALEYMKNEDFGRKADPLKVYIEKDADGNEVKKAVFEKGDLLHLSNIKGHLEAIKKDNCLKPLSLLEDFKGNFYGDAKHGGVHFLEIPEDYNSFGDKKFKGISIPDVNLAYFYSCAKQTYNQGGDRAGFVIDGSVVEEMSKFDLMHAMENLVVDQRLRDISNRSSYYSQNYYKTTAGLMNESQRLLRDKCFFLGMPLSYTKAITMFDGSWGNVKQENIDKVLQEFGDEVPVVVNGVVVNNPNPAKVEIVDKDYIKEEVNTNKTEGR